MISKELFVSTIEALRMQMAHDKKTASLHEEAFGTENFLLYDNSLVIKALIKLLKSHFPENESFCEISFYIFDCDFGKSGAADESPETPGSLYNRLIDCQHLLDANKCCLSCGVPAN